MFEFALVTAAQEAEQHRDLPMPAWVFGVLARAAFFTLFAITWPFRCVGTRP